MLSHFSCVWLCATHRRQPTRLLRPQDSLGKDTGVGCHFLLQCRKVKFVHIDKEKVEAVTDFILLSYKITIEYDWSHEIKRHLLLGRKVMTNLDSLLKSSDITLPTNVHLVQAMVFSSSRVWMWELDYQESWVPKNWCFWTVVLEKTLESPLNCKEIQPVHPKGDQSWIFTGRTDAGAETPTPIMWCKELTHWKRPWCQERLKAAGEGDDGGWDGWMASLSQWTWVWENSRRWWWTGRPGMLRFMGSQRVRHDWATELNWTEWIIEKAREFQKNSYFCFINYAKAFDYVDHYKLWKILKEMGIPEYLTCLLRNLYGQDATVKMDRE